jgi:hypothetical protein
MIITEVHKDDPTPENPSAPNQPIPINGPKDFNDENDPDKVDDNTDLGIAEK